MPVLGYMKSTNELGSSMCIIIIIIFAAVLFQLEKNYIKFTSSQIDYLLLYNDFE